MANFEQAVVKTLIHEGGAKITDDPNDRGGLTRYGISQRSYPNVDIRNLSETQAKEIYKADYWDKIQGDAINDQAIAEAIFDTAVNMGPRTTARLVQLALDIEPVDGIIGNQTVASLQQVNNGSFIAQFTLAKIARYVAICQRNSSQRRFLLGWINRALGAAS